MKQVIVIRKDLNLRKGKMCAHAAHVSNQILFLYGLDCPRIVQWIRDDMRKIVVGVNSEQELIDVYDKADGAGLLACLIHDKGYTEVPPNTPIAAAIGPDDPDKVDLYTGHLNLL